MNTIVPGVHQVGSSAVNSFIIDGDEGVTLVDTGLPRRHGAIVEALGAIGRSPDDVSAIVVTHSHADHVGGAAALASKSGAAVHAGAADAAAIRGDEPAPPPPVLDRVPFLKPVFRLMPDPLPVGEVTVDPSALPSDLTAIPTPGHTPGHTAYLLDRAGGVVFVGDAAVATKAGKVKRGWMNRAEPVFDGSLRTLAGLRFQVACFGHSPAITVGADTAFARFVEALA